MTTSYRCDTCGREFDEAGDCRLHEARCAVEPREEVVPEPVVSNGLALVRLFNNWTPGEQP